jgi:hypothetical protein
MRASCSAVKDLQKMCTGKKPNKSVSMILLKRTWYDTTYGTMQKYWLNSYNDVCKLLPRQGLTEDVFGKETKQISFYDFIKKDMV